MAHRTLLCLLLILLCGCAAGTPAQPSPGSSSTPGIGSTWKRPADSMLMVFVPAGNFSMGSPDNFGFDYERPAHTVYLDAFWIDKTDVTNAMYAGCVQAGACKAPYSTESKTRKAYYGNSKYDNFPVVFVDWRQAAAYCQWAGASLPTEAQWEKAARGTDGRNYPWGNTDPTCKLANYGGASACAGDTTAVNSHPKGASPYGALDMSGNVWQWTSDWFDPAYYSQSPQQNPTGPAQALYDSNDRVVKGGSWLAKVEWIHSENRVNASEGAGDNVIGFRCARPAP